MVGRMHARTVSELSRGKSSNLQVKRESTHVTSPVPKKDFIASETDTAGAAALNKVYDRIIKILLGARGKDSLSKPKMLSA